MAIGVGIYILTNDNKKIALIAPTGDQASIMRNYIAEHIIACPELTALVEFEKDMSSVERLRKEASRSRWTFRNGCELRILSAQGEAQRLLGFGANLVIIDESSGISREAYAKIVRMLGDDPENSILVELSNPWSRDSKYYDHWCSENFFKIHIPYQVGLEEGRTTQAFIKEMSTELTPPEFQVLYESNFPDEGEDSLFRLSWIEKAVTQKINVTGKKIISCDPADRGIDRTVIMRGIGGEQGYIVEEIYSEDYSDNMSIANRIIDSALTHKVDIINVDCIGIGAGVVSRLREVLSRRGVTINACHFGESPESLVAESPLSTKKRFANKKAEQYFRLRNLFEDGRISIPSHQRLKSELLSMKWEKPGSEKIRIIDPEDKSPDFSDCLCYFTWKSGMESGWFFG